MSKKHNIIYTWGYTGSTPEDLRQFIRATGAWLCDIRYSPRSRVPHWNQWPLLKVAEHGYAYLIGLGNENYNTGGPIKLAAPYAALPFIEHTLQTQPVILLCACRHVEECHRKVAAEFLAQATGAEVVHLPARFADWRHEDA